jgi:6-phosphogluconolactonase
VSPETGTLDIANGELRLVDDVPRAFVALVQEEHRTKVSADGGAPGRFTLALSGGETARACYELLARAADIDWTNVECFLGDERCVPPDDADANQAMIRRALIERVLVGRFHPMDCEHPEQYAALLEATLPLDLVHLGLGPDGHTASLFPDSPALDARPGKLVVHNIDRSGLNKHERLTLTFDALARCDLAVYTVTGSGKHEALHRILEGEALPAAEVRPSRAIWLCDREALGEDIGRVR